MKIRSLLLLPIIAALLSATPSQAQDTTKPAQLSEREWKALEGYFTSPQNKDMKVHFEVADGMLVAHLLWNGAVIHLVPSSPLIFTSKEKEHDEPIHVTFHPDSSGDLNKIEVDNQVWTREKNYKPLPEKKEFPHTPEMLKPYEGLYQSQDNQTLFMQFTVRDNHLFLKQHWNEVELSFAPLNDTSFYGLTAPQYTLDFEKDAKGKVLKMTAFKRNVWLPRSLPHFSDAQKKALSGVYVSKDDPDNSIRLTAKGEQLVVTQLWDKKEITLDARADTYFYNEKESYPLVILKDEKGNITSLVVLTTNTFIKKD